MTYREAIAVIQDHYGIKRESWDKVYLKEINLFDVHGYFVGCAVVEIYEDEYIGLYTSEPRDEFTNDWVVIQ